MHFFSTRTSSPFLFIQWQTNDLVGLATSMLTTATIGFLFESLHLFEYKLPIIERLEMKRTENTAPLTVVFKRSVFHIVRISTGYVLMLTVMTMNLWILVSLLLGHGTGYLLFRPWSLMKSSVRGPKKRQKVEGNFDKSPQMSSPLMQDETVI